jgi:hypothetical protein
MGIIEVGLEVPVRERFDYVRRDSEFIVMAVLARYSRFQRGS